MAETTVLKAANIEAAQKAVTDYKATCTDIFTRMQGTISSLTAAGAGFNGDSSNGYNEFFTKITPALTTNLYEDNNSLMMGLHAMLGGIKETLLDQEDPALGNANRNAGGQGAAAGGAAGATAATGAVGQ